MNKKKILGCLLGGGVATIACTLVGLKLNDKISYDRQISHYKKLAEEFVGKAKLSSASDEGKWYLPEWLDDLAWKTTHNNKYSENNEENRRIRPKFLKEYPRWEDFKKHCYDMAQAGKYDVCTDEQGWCTECARNDAWEFEKERAGKIK